MKPKLKLIALVAVMSALGNVLGFLSIRLPSAPGTTVEFHLSALPSLFLAVSIAPLWGALTGALSLIMATIRIGNIFIPFGNALLAGMTGFFSMRFKFSPPASGALAMLLYSPYIWFTCMIYHVPRFIISFIIVKAFIEVLISCTIIEFILLKSEIRRLLASFKG